MNSFAQEKLSLPHNIKVGLNAKNVRISASEAEGIGLNLCLGAETEFQFVKLKEGE